MREASAAYRRGDWAAAERLCRSILHVDGRHGEALNLLGIIAAQTQRPVEALEFLQRAAAAQPGDAAAHNNLGGVLQSLGRHAEALICYERALEIDSGDADAYYNRGLTLQAIGRPNDSLRSLRRAVQLNPRLAEAHYWCGLLCHRLEQWTEAVASYDAALALRAGYAEAHNERGVSLHALGRLHDAIASYGRALECLPSLAAAYVNRGNALQQLRRLEEALWNYRRAVELRPELAEAYVNQGNVLQELGRMDDALACYARAIEVRPAFAAAHVSQGNALKRLGRISEALSCYERGLRLEPGYEWLYGTELHTGMLLCRWDEFGARVGELGARILRQERAIPPFPVLALIDSLPMQRRAAEVWVRAQYRGDDLPPISSRVRRGKIRVGYFSADYYNHATALLMAGIFAGHDRGDFEWIAFSLGPDRRDAMRGRLQNAFDQFIDVGTQSDRDVAELSRHLGIDIAVDLKGFTEDQRAGIFALRAAPVQVSYLGYPATSGSAFIDYLIADDTVIPPESRPFYSEKIVYLPHSYYPTSYSENGAHAPRPRCPASRADAGLPADAVVFCCFNNTYKITPETFASWMRILAGVPDSVLWLFEGNRSAGANLRREAQARGVDGSRLIFAPRLPWSEHMARHDCADLFLDTLPYNAHTTASDALWTGLPVLTCRGEAFAARVAASMLETVGLPELIATDRSHYERVAVELAGDRARLGALRARLQASRLTNPLFDTALLTRHLEIAYRRMLERHESGLPPEHLHIV